MFDDRHHFSYKRLSDCLFAAATDLQTITRLTDFDSWKAGDVFGCIQRCRTLVDRCEHLLLIMRERQSEAKLPKELLFEIADARTGAVTRFPN